MPRQPQKSSAYVTMCHACHSIKSRNVTKTNRKHHSQPTSHMPRIPRAIKQRQDHQAPHVPYTLAVDVTQRHACHRHDPRRHKKHGSTSEPRPLQKRNVDVTMHHTNGHALDTHRASNPRENYRNATSMSPCTTRATQGDHRWHQVPRLHAKTHLASQPRARVISEETRPRHIRGKFPRHNRGAFPTVVTDWINSLTNGTSRNHL